MQYIFTSIYIHQDSSDSNLPSWTISSSCFTTLISNYLFVKISKIIQSDHASYSELQSLDSLNKSVNFGFKTNWAQVNTFLHVLLGVPSPTGRRLSLWLLDRKSSIVLMLYHLRDFEAMFLYGYVFCGPGFLLAE